MVDLGNGLGTVTWIDGVETEEQLGLLAQGGCAAVLGFLLGRPQTRDELVNVGERASDRRWAAQGDVSVHRLPNAAAA